MKLGRILQIFMASFRLGIQFQCSDDLFENGPPDAMETGDILSDKTSKQSHKVSQNTKLFEVV